MSSIDTIKHLMLLFGTEWVLWLLGGLSFASLILIMERWLFYRSCQGNVRVLAEDLDQHLSQNNHTEAILRLKQSSSVAANVAIAGMKLGYRGVTASREAMQSAAALQRSRLQKHLSYLGTIGNNAPFVGLLGTVIGVIHAFDELGHASANAAAPAAASQIASQAVMTAVAEALVATAVGIIVAIPAVGAFNFLQRRVAEIIAETEVLSSLVLAYLSDHTTTGMYFPPEPPLAHLRQANQHSANNRVDCQGVISSHAP